MDPPLDILGMTSPELAREAKSRLPSGTGVAAKVYSLAFATGKLEPEKLGLSAPNVRAWLDAFRVGLLEVRELAEEPGEFGTSVKAVLATADGKLIECVRVPMPLSTGQGRCTICISSQVGCRMGCTFCETGRAGLVRHLSAAEIVSQVVTARTVLGWDATNVVFMGMGEPLDNFDGLVQALRVLTDHRGLSLGWERITVCTSGLATGIDRLRALGLKRLNLSVSLNAGRDATRGAIMPVNRAWDLERLTAHLLAYPQRRSFVLGVNYCLIPGVNDSREEAEGVVAFCRRLGRALVNLIPYNPGTEPIARAPTEEETRRFRAWIAEGGIEVRVRATKGRSILAGCGQLGSGMPGDADRA